MSLDFKPCQLSSLYFSSFWVRCICVPSSCLSIEFRDYWNWCGFHTILHLCLWVPACSSSSSFHTHVPFPTFVLWALDSRIGHKYNLTENNSCIRSSLCNKSMDSLVILCLWLNPNWCGNYNQISSKISNSFCLHMGGSDSSIVRGSHFVGWANPGSNLSFDITAYVSLDSF